MGKENGIPETKVDVNFQLINRDQEQNTTSLIVILSYMIVLTVLWDQWNHHSNQPLCLVVMSMNQANSAKDEVEELARPCLNMLNRLTYEVTEIALDLPGINLEF